MDFLSLFFYRLPQDYIPKKRKKKVSSCIFSQESWCSSTNHVCKYNCMYSILHSYIHSTSKTSTYIFCKSSSHRFFCVRWGVFSPEQLLCGLSDRNQCATHPDYLVGCHILIRRSFKDFSYIDDSIGKN